MRCHVSCSASVSLPVDTPKIIANIVYRFLMQSLFLDDLVIHTNGTGVFQSNRAMCLNFSIFWTLVMFVAGFMGNSHVTLLLCLLVFVFRLNSFSVPGAMWYSSLTLYVLIFKNFQCHLHTLLNHISPFTSRHHRFPDICDNQVILSPLTVL